MNKLIIARIDDWEGIYYQGKLIKEGHHILRWELVSLMEKYETFNVEEFFLNEETDKFMLDDGTLPLDFKDIEQYII